MNRLRLSLGSVIASLLLVAAGSPALADGGYRGLKDAPAAYSWTGLYIGVNAGIGTADTKADLGLGGFLNIDNQLSGNIYGGQIGYNYQVGQIVYGIEASYNGTNIQGTTTCFFALECKGEIESFGTVTGRMGLAMDKSLLYVLGGVAWGKVNADVKFLGIPLGSDDQTHVGWVAGLGFEQMLTKNLSMRIEYSHIDLGEKTYFGVADVDVVVDTVRLGVNYKF